MIVANHEFQEIRGQDFQAAFSQKSDVYAFGCILYRLCTLSDIVFVLDDIKPSDISADYSMELLSLTSSMLSLDRDERPTATQAKEKLAAIGLQMFTTATLHCSTCHETFPSRNQLSKHLKKAGHWHGPQNIVPLIKTAVNSSPTNGEVDLKIRGVAEAVTEYHFDPKNHEEVDPTPCFVCRRHFNTKKHFFGHLHGANHYRGPKYVMKRRADDEVDIDEDRQDKRLTTWIQREMHGSP